MATNQDLFKRRQQSIPKGIGTAFPFFAERAENSELWDVEDNRYLDFVGGISVLNTGHTHPQITQAVIEQVQKFSHTAFQVMAYEPYIELAEKLNTLVPGNSPKKTLLLSTGAEAVENAIKIARAHTNRHGVIAFVGGFHGRTMMTMALTGKVDPYKKKFAPFSTGVYHIPYPNTVHDISEADSLKALANLFKADIEPSDVAAIIIEPVQGEGGFYAASSAFFKQLRAICDEHSICLICDEVQTCFGRTGTLFASEQIGVEPDLITAAKSLAGGYPLSAVIGKAEIMDAPDTGGLGGTYAGSPVACVAALEVLKVIESENLLARSQKIGEILSTALTASKATNHHIGDIRTKGAMFAFELVDDQGNPDPERTKIVVAKAMEQKLMLLSCGLYGNTIRIMVPLTVSDAILQEGIGILQNVLRDI